MAEYIDREAVLNILASKNAPWDGYQKVSELPAADVQPVVKAKWEVCGMFDDIGRCSNCHYMFPLDTAMTEFHFCPHCGARMDGAE